VVVAWRRFDSAEHKVWNLYVVCLHEPEHALQKAQALLLKGLSLSLCLCLCLGGMWVGCAAAKLLHGGIGRVVAEDLVLLLARKSALAQKRYLLGN